MTSQSDRFWRDRSPSKLQEWDCPSNGSSTSKRSKWTGYLSHLLVVEKDFTFSAGNSIISFFIFFEITLPV